MKKQNQAEYPIPVLKQMLHECSKTRANALTRSVSRLTSVDEVPCMEYGDEVARQQELARQLLFVQHCRNALERVVVLGEVTLNYCWQQGTSTATVFKKVGPNRVRVSGYFEV